MILWPRMERIARLLLVVVIGWVAGSCAPPPPPPDPVAPGQTTRQIVAERVCAVIVTGRSNLDQWVGRNFVHSQAPRDADGGSAAPVTADGYFLTADHVLSGMSGRNVFLVYSQGGHFQTEKARVVWRSKESDLALLHIPRKTPYFYQWTDPAAWLPEGSRVLHGGIATGFRSDDGKLGTTLAPQGYFTGSRRFKMDIPLQPGDSGGPVVDSYGRLVGINSAVEFLVPLETAFFIDSEGNRPNVHSIDALIARDRARNSP